MAFKTAARIGFRAACEKADPRHIGADGEYGHRGGRGVRWCGHGRSSISRGRIVGTDSNDAGETVIMVRVPYAEVVTYTKDLRSISRGSGSYYIQIEGYEEAPHDVQKKLAEEYQAARAAGTSAPASEPRMGSPEPIGCVFPSIAVAGRPCGRRLFCPRPCVRSIDGLTSPIINRYR